MEKKTFNICIEVLNRLERAGVLKHIILIGSWSIYFYKYYFKSKEYLTYIRTKDIDFVIPTPFKFYKKINLLDLIEDLGFLEEYKGSKGYIKLEHPDLTIEFLVPERGRGHNKPYFIPQLNINAQPLRFLDFLVDNSISIKVNNLHIRLPHPAAYAFQKFIIFKRRRTKDKHDRDIEGALRVFRELIRSKHHSTIKRIFNKMHKRWQQRVISNLKSIDEQEVVDVLKRKGA